MLERGLVAEAEGVYQELSRDPGQQAESFYGLGLVSLKKHDSTAAQYWFSKSVEANPREANAHFYLGELAALRGDHDAATRLFAQVLALSPRHVGALKRITSIPSGPTINVAPPPPPKRFAKESSETTPPVKEVVGLPPRPPSSASVIVGRARLVKLQPVAFNGTPGAKQSLTFRLDVADDDGNLVRTVGVEMRSFHVRGTVENGDCLEIDKISRTGKVKSLSNLSTGQRVKTRMF